MIQLNNVCKTYRSGRGITSALTDISFSVNANLAVAVAGKSGSGKTTLLNCIGGIERPDRGTVFCFGRAVHELSSTLLSQFQRQKVGFIFQQCNLLSYLTVFENVAFPLILNGIGGKKKQRRVEELLDKVGLGNMGDALPCELSGGKIQRVSAARALAHSPQLVLADEPTASLDSETGKMLVELMFEIGRQQKCTMIISTHDSEIIDLADDCIYMRDGNIKQEQN
jgi:ABC-type lipoprotein export system ATPase subunit